MPIDANIAAIIDNVYGIVAADKQVLLITAMNDTHDRWRSTAILVLFSMNTKIGVAA